MEQEKKTKLEIDLENGWKICSSCKEQKELTKFLLIKRENENDRFCAKCKSCLNKTKKSYKRKPITKECREEIKKARKEWNNPNPILKEFQLSNSKKCTKCEEEKTLNFFEHKRNICRKCEHKRKYAKYGKGGLQNKLRNNYATEEWYYNQLKIQNNLCKICHKPESSKDKNGKIRNLCIDHCHKNNKARGLLCNNCNQGLGRFKDNTESLQSAIEYLKAAKLE